MKIEINHLTIYLKAERDELKIFKNYYDVQMALNHGK